MKKILKIFLVTLLAFLILGLIWFYFPRNIEGVSFGPNVRILLYEAGQVKKLESVNSQPVVAVLNEWLSRSSASWQISFVSWVPKLMFIEASTRINFMESIVVLDFQGKSYTRILTNDDKVLRTLLLESFRKTPLAQ